MNKIATIIVLTSKVSSDVTQKCIRAVEENTCVPYELIVLRDDPKDFAFGRNNNRIIKSSETKYIVLLNDDCFVEPDWLSKMIAKAESSDKIAIVGPKIKGVNGEIQYESDKENPPFIAFACALIKREVLQVVGPITERYRLGFEDIEFSDRVRRFGYKVAVATDVTCLHLKNTSTVALSKVLLKARDRITHARLKGQSIYTRSVLMQIVFDLTWRPRRFIMHRVPAVYFALKRLRDSTLRRAGIW